MWTSRLVTACPGRLGFEASCRKPRFQSPSSNFAHPQRLLYIITLYTDSTLVRFFLSFDDAYLTSVLTSLGSLELDGILTFKFDTSSNGWDKDVYLRVVQDLVEALSSKDGKSILECVPSL